MTASQPHDLASDDRGDADLIAAVRAGDTDAYGTLFDRHRHAALRLARQITNPTDADDLVAEAFTKVLSVLEAGGGPDESFRAYLLTSVRRLNIDAARRAARVTPTDDDAALDQAVAFVDPAAMAFESGAAARAFSSLPERWQLVLWHLDVEGETPTVVAPLLGLSPNSVSALAYRAREGLRQAYLQQHLAQRTDEACRSTLSRLGAHVRHGLSARAATQVEAHLDECARCAGLYLELRDVNHDLAAVLGPAVLGTASISYLGGAVTTAATAAAIGTTTAVSVAVTTQVVASGALSVITLPARVALAGAAPATQVAITAATTAGLATGTLVVAETITTPPAVEQVVAAPSDLPSPEPTGTSTGEPESEPTPEATLEPEPILEPEPVVEPVPDAEADGTTEMRRPQSARPDTSEEEDAAQVQAPAPPPPPPPANLGIGSISTAKRTTFLQHEVTVALSGVPTAPQATTVQFAFPGDAAFRGVNTPGWTCTPPTGTVTRAVSCSTVLPAGQAASLSVDISGGRLSGFVSVFATGDPDRSNDTSAFVAPPWLLVL